MLRPIVRSQLLVYRAHQAFPICLAWSPVGRRLVSADQQGLAHVWGAAAGTSLLTSVGQQSWVTALAWSPDGTRIASLDQGQVLQVWEATTGETL